MGGQFGGGGNSHEQRVPFGRGAGCLNTADQPARADAGFHHHLFLVNIRESLRHDACEDVRAGAGGGGHDHADRAGGELGVGGEPRRCTGNGGYSEWSNGRKVHVDLRGDAGEYVPLTLALSP